jgi:hypothetical protein
MHLCLPFFPQAALKTEPITALRLSDELGILSTDILSMVQRCVSAKDVWCLINLPIIATVFFAEESSF